MKTDPALVPVEIPVLLVLNSIWISNWVMYSRTRGRASTLSFRDRFFEVGKMRIIFSEWLIRRRRTRVSPTPTTLFLTYRSSCDR